MTLLSAPSERAFADRRRPDWDALSMLLTRVREVGLKRLTPDEVMRISPLYRDVCADLSRAQAAHYGAPLIEYLQGLTASAHETFYAEGNRRGRLIDGGALLPRDAWWAAFPRAVRRRWRPMVLATALFFVPFAVALALSLHDATFAYRVAPQSMLEELARGYAEGFDDGRDGATGTAMAGYYVNHNVGIALRCFALGIMFGVGSAFYLAFNGLATGAIIGYVIRQGAGANIVTFIVGHSSLELGAICLAGGAGLAMGWSLVAPGERTRLASLQTVSADIVVIVLGAAVMLCMAAGVEAFWSASSVPSLVKRIVGGAMLSLVLGYLALAGRRRSPS
jgi:uncharacterized membrane protein SpoIIM required for sporulation